MQPDPAELTLRAPAARTRTPPLVFGMVLFLASELMFFGGLFASYFTLRGLTTVWPPSYVHLDLVEPLVATVILTASSVTMHAATQGLRRADPAALQRWLALTFLLGAVFLGIKAHEFTVAGFGISSHAYGSLFYTMLGAHGLHLAVGMVLLAVVYARSLAGAYDGARVNGGPHAGPEAVGWYWHFVDVVWLGIFSTIWLVR